MIDVRELRARRGDTLVLEGLSLRIEDGEFLVVAGGAYAYREDDADPPFQRAA